MRNIFVDSSTVTGKSISKNSCLFVILILICFSAHAQLKDTTLHIQYPAKGFVLLKNSEKVSIKGLNYLNSDTVILFEKNTADTKGNKVYSKLTLLYNVYPRMESIADIKLLKDSRHAHSKGAVTGAVIGFGLGYLAGFLLYEDKFDITDDENRENRKSKAALYGLGGSIPVGLTGALLGGIILRKNFTRPYRRSTNSKLLVARKY